MYLFAIFLVLYEFTTYAANDMIMPGMIQVVDYFHASQSNVALSMSYYILGNCFFLLLVGFFSEQYGKRRILILGNLLFFIFSVLIIFSHNIHQFMVWRFFQGVGLSIIAVGYALIHQHFNDKSAIKLIALMANVSLLAPLFGPLIGSLIVSYLFWYYVFIFTALFSLMTLIGLYRTIPKESPPIIKPLYSDTIKQYGLILKNKEFLQGMFCSVFAVMTLLIWISQAANLILYKLHLDFTHYVIYQLISIGGLTLSSILMQHIVGKYRIYSIVKMGSALLLIGLFISLIGSNRIEIIVAGLCIYALGTGFANGCIMRLIMSIQTCSHGVIATMLGFLQTFFYVIGIVLINKLYSYFNFSLWSFTISTFILGLIAYLLITRYISAYRDRAWH